MKCNVPVAEATQGEGVLPVSDNTGQERPPATSLIRVAARIAPIAESSAES